MRPDLECASYLLSPFPSTTSINKLQVMENASLTTATGCTQTYNICITKHSHFPCTSTYSSTPHNSNRKHNIQHIPNTNIQHTSTLQDQKNTIFTKARYTVTTTHIKTNMRHIHTSIVSRHLATRGNNKILRTPPHRSSEVILLRLTHRTLAQRRTHKSHFLKSYLHNVEAKITSISTMAIPPWNTSITSSLQLHPHTHHVALLDNNNNSVTCLPQTYINISLFFCSQINSLEFVLNIRFSRFSHYIILELILISCVLL